MFANSFFRVLHAIGRSTKNVNKFSNENILILNLLLQKKLFNLT